MHFTSPVKCWVRQIYKAILFKWNCEQSHWPGLFFYCQSSVMMWVYWTKQWTCLETSVNVNEKLRCGIHNLWNKDKTWNARMSENNVICLIFILEILGEKKTYAFLSFLTSYTNSFYNKEEKDCEVHKHRKNLRGQEKHTFWQKQNKSLKEWYFFKKTFISQKRKTLVESTALSLQQS